MLYFSENRYQHKVGEQATQRQPDGGEGPNNQLVIFFDQNIRELLHDHREKSDADDNACERLFGGEANFTEGTVGKGDQEEAQHEAVAVIQPVRLLEAVPDQVKRAGGKGGHEE